ncbi:MAG: sorbosone dehydrogenase family protein [Elusimicrobia bacterium]|nr:sorbosone dehydrogenase family protein [Elusimicrobiota bacterium]
MTSKNIFRGSLVPSLLWLCAGAEARTLPLEKIKLPPGFKISLYASGVEDARSLAQGPPGVLFVGTRRAGAVYAIIEDPSRARVGEIFQIAWDLQMPNGVAYREGSLYVAEVNRILRYDHILPLLESPPDPVVVFDGLPQETAHGWKFIRLGPDGRLYVPVGAPCNVCKEADPRFASIARLNPDGSGFEIFARGVRNSVGFDWDPRTQELWFTDNGRDWLGDDAPPDELNHAPKPGMDFGFPHCHGKGISDPKYGKEYPCSRFTPPAQELAPHAAALGIRFYTGTMFPEKYRGQIFIAEHGSWNRSKKAGYRLTVVRLQEGKPASYEVFAEGWLQGRSAWGRPVDLEVMPDGSLLVSDDHANAIYRISYEK